MSILEEKRKYHRQSTPYSLECGFSIRQPHQDLLSEVLPSDPPWALVTGASKGIGRGIAIGLAKAGWNIAINYFQDRQGATETESLIGQVGSSQTLLVPADVGDPAQVIELFQILDEKTDGLSLLVNNAGLQNEGSVLNLSHETWERTLKTNLTGPFLCTQQAAQRMCSGMGGSIINIGSGANQHPFPGLIDHSVTKAGLDQLTRVSAIELGPYGVRVNCVAPGCIATERSTREDPDFEGTWAPLTPLNAIGDPVDIADAVCFLASQAARFINGQTLYVDGALWSQVPWPFKTHA